MSATAVDPYDPNQLDEYVYPYKRSGSEVPKVPLIRQLLWFCAGADIELLRQCPRSEQVKEEGIGGIVLATALLAFLSGSYAMYIVFGPKVGLALSPEQQTLDVFAAVKSIAFGAVWALIILNLDRFVVSSTGHGDGTSEISLREFAYATPRIVMAIIIGLCLSAPLEIRVMKSEIEAKLTEKQQVYVEGLDAADIKRFDLKFEPLLTKKAEAEAKIRKIEEDLQKRDAAVAVQRKKVDDEASGRGTQGKSGIGSIYAALDRTLKTMEQETASYAEGAKADREQLLSEVKAATAEMDALRKALEESKVSNQAKANNLDGIITRVHIAHDIGGLSFWFLMGLLMIIEVSPIFLKMMIPKGPYLSLLENQNRIVLARNAITTEQSLSPGARTTAVHDEAYHRAETIAAFEVGHLRVERSLADHALKAFEARVAEDIRANPSKYVEAPRGGPA